MLVVFGYWSFFCFLVDCSNPWLYPCHAPRWQRLSVMFHFSGFRTSFPQSLPRPGWGWRWSQFVFHRSFPVYQTPALRTLFNPAADGDLRAAVALGLGLTLSLDPAVLHCHGAGERSKRLKESFNNCVCPFHIRIGAYTGEMDFSTGNPGRAKGFCLLETIGSLHRAGRAALLAAGHLEVALQCIVLVGTRPLYPECFLGLQLQTCRVHWLLLCSPRSGQVLRADQVGNEFEPAMGLYV